MNLLALDIGSSSVKAGLLHHGELMQQVARAALGPRHDRGHAVVRRHLADSRVVDPSNASFMGVYNTLTVKGWNEQLREAVGAGEHELPQLMDADAVGGMISAAVADDFGLTHGTPMLVGCMDG